MKIDIEDIEQLAPPSEDLSDIDGRDGQHSKMRLDDSYSDTQTPVKFKPSQPVNPLFQNAKMAKYQQSLQGSIPLESISSKHMSAAKERSLFISPSNLGLGLRDAVI